MNRNVSSMTGVTLLEILLVLAISASIIMMSVRYYGSATYSLQANTVIQQVQGITAAIDSYTGGGSYGGINDTLIKPLLPGSSMITPWGTSIAISDPLPSSYQVTLPSVPKAVCALIYSKLQSNNHYQISTPCNSGNSPTDFKYTYVATA